MGSDVDPVYAGYAETGDIIISSDNADKLKFMELHFPPEAFDRMSPDEK